MKTWYLIVWATVILGAPLVGMGASALVTHYNLHYIVGIYICMFWGIVPCGFVAYDMNKGKW